VRRAYVTMAEIQFAAGAKTVRPVHEQARGYGSLDEAKQGIAGLTMKPFLDHEMFHLYHHRFFPGCDPLWCNVWEEGMAVYVASKLNPGATDEQLLLNQPRPIRPEVEPRLREAMCSLRAKFDSTSEEDYANSLIAEKGLSRDSNEFNQSIAEFQQRMQKYLQDRLYPNMPDWPVFCFYPMTKRRDAVQNWFTLPFEKRKELMNH